MPSNSGTVHLDTLTPDEEHEAVLDLLGGMSLVDFESKWGITDRTLARDLEQGRYRVTVPSLRLHAIALRNRKRQRQPPKASTEVATRPTTPADSETGLETLIREFGDLRLFLIDSITELRKHGDHRGTILGIKAMMDLLEKAQTLSEKAEQSKTPTKEQAIEATVLSYNKLREELTK